MEISEHSKLEQFLKQIEINKKIILITSGNTRIKIDKTETKYIEILNTGKRAAKIAEEFLKKDYYVIFLCRESSPIPFVHHTNMKE
jgi:hypothetical protein